MWIPREITSCLKQTAAARPSVLVTGCRQAGKTSVLEKTFPEYGYVSLDLPRTAEEAEHSGEAFLSRHRPPLIIDEVQYAPELLRYLKVDIDRHRGEFGRYLLTGSQHFALMEGVSESLAGRISLLSLHSLSARELSGYSGDLLEGEKLLHWMVTGGYPELHARDLNPARYFSDYLATYLERDVRSVINVRNLRDFDRLLRLLSLRTGQLLSFNSLASDLGVSPNTVKAWMSVLETSNIIYLLPPYFENLGKRLVKAPKLFFLDTGLACFLSGIRSAAELKKSTLLGGLFENHVLGQIVRHFANRGEIAEVYFYRDHHGREVDFLIPSGGKLQLVECKWSETPSSKQRGFEALQALAPERILSKTVVNSTAGTRLIKDGVRVADSITLDFLAS